MSNTNNVTPLEAFKTIQQLITPLPGCDMFQIKMDEGFMGVRTNTDQGVNVETQKFQQATGLLILFNISLDVDVAPGINVVEKP